MDFETTSSIILPVFTVSRNFPLILTEIFNKMIMFWLLEIQIELKGMIIMAIKIVIKRHFKKHAAQEAFGLLNDFRREAMGQPGYISGETWVNHYDPSRIAVVSTWQTVTDWIQWEESDQRAANEAKLEGLLQTPVKFEIYDLGVFPAE
jgi:heme-degrading monooxygenase HmoA